MVKPFIDTSQAAELLSKYFGQPVGRLVPVGSGQIASAFSFRVGSQDYIIRFVTRVMATSFEKEQFIFQKLSPSSIPVPSILYTDVFNDFYFAVSRRVPGVPLDELSNEDYQRVIPALMETLDAIHQTDISDTRKYGDFDEKGVGRFDSWTEFLLSVADEEAEDGFYGKWHRLFDETFLDREFFDYIYERMKALLRYCPEERFLLHADYGFGNALAKDGKITAVLDWANAMYGDFLYDVAWLDLGYPDADYCSLFRQYYEAKGQPIPYYRERIVCYQCYISLDSQRWYGKTGKLKDYQWMRERILGILGRSSFG